MFEKSSVAFLFIILIVISVSIIIVSAADCWSYTTQSGCESDSSCKWKNDSWGAWCEELNCWSLYNQSACLNTIVPGKNCTWQEGGTSYGCERISCWSFSGTNANSCVNNSAELNCEWSNSCYSIGYNPSGVDCWSITNQDTCLNTTGCGWGQCMEKGCWSYADQSSCESAKDWNGNNCTWDSSGGYCTENGCWKYSNQSACTNTSITRGLNCQWKWDSCQEIDCWNWDYTNETACVNNSLNLSCTWNQNWCNRKDCWSYTTNESCSSSSQCVWKAYISSGWCEEVNCWTWDAWNGGSESACLGNASIYGLDCVWRNGSDYGWESGGWCEKDWSSVSCSNKTTERECMDTYYCWWQYNDWDNISAGGTCNDPYNWGIEINTSISIEWNPGCYIFDLNASDCGKILGCDNSTAGQCNINQSHANADFITNNGINCSMINDSSLCNSIPSLSSCCIWQNGSCTQNKLSTSCWDQMEAPPEGASYCEDYNSYTSQALCEQIAGYPWYMPCEWNNSTEKCGFKASDVFGNETQNLMKIENKKNCEAAGGKWIIENYCEGNISVPTGRCEYKFNEEDNCDKACFACETKDSNGNVVNASNAESACENSALGFCEFQADTNAPNGIGYCKVKEQFKKGIAEDCDSDCGACTYLGNPNSNDTTKRPSYYCLNSKANSDEGGCKWVTDNSTSQGGYCIDKGEKTCEDACDRCYTRDDCSNIGRTAVANVSGSCKWQGSDEDGSCVPNIGEDVEICWDGVDNTNDGLIDCADPACYSDTYCGFVSGDCFGWQDNNSCINNGCEWVSDKWGSWCDFPGSQCWKYDTNEANCSSQENCEWNNGTGSGWCEQDWSVAEVCMGLNRTACESLSYPNNGNCTWTNDTWCVGEGNGTEWCQNYGGWCDHVAFAPKNCWMYESSSAECNNVSGCSWHVDEYSQPHCEINWSENCWLYVDSSSCSNAGCWWRTDNWGSFCTHITDKCWNSVTEDSCEFQTDSDGNYICYWSSSNNMCSPLCFNSSNSISQSSCDAQSGCYWVQEAGWCEEEHVDSCYNETNFNNQTNCEQTENCRWRNPGWCDPKSGFSSGAMASGGGIGGAIGADCYKYDGNQSLCTNKSLINISCGWTTNSAPSCDIDWSVDCWQYNSAAGGCNETNGCWWNSEWQYCTNIMDQCWSNMSLQNDPNACNENPYCNNNSWGGCEPSCFNSSLSSNQEDCSATTGCRWISGWCNPASMTEMFSGMETGAPVPLGGDTCDLSETNQASVDICGFGMKDMEDSYGFGINVYNFENASICNKEKLSSFVMEMIGGGVGGGIGGGGAGERIGSGNETVKLYIYLDTDGSTTGSCVLSHNSSAEGYEFRLKYVSEWNSSLSKATETFNVYKCENSKWKVTDIKARAWKKKMCSEIGGPMIAIKKGDLNKYPLLYDSTKDLRVVVATADAVHNITNPSDVAGPGWTTPGAIDFEIQNAFSYGADNAKFEDILRNGFVEYEDCFNEIDDDSDGNVDCNDWDCQYADVCSGIGVNAAGYVDTSSPLVTGVKIEEYPDSALIMYDTNKPSNGTLEFYHNDSQCLTLNTTIYDVGIIKNNTVREYKLWHYASIYNGSNSLSFALQNNTRYYYKLKVCDSNGKCAVSKCSSFITTSVSKCPYCKFVTKIKVPSGWEVYYDLDQDGSYEHWQGHMCGPNAGMKTNYTAGRKANIKINETSSGIYIEFINVTLTKSGLNDKVRTISSSSSLIHDTSEGYVGMQAETRDKIINNLHPEVCRIKIPKAADGSCNKLYHCDDDGNNCIDRTDDATLLDSSNCVWQLPYCEFSTWDADNNPSSNDNPDDSSSSGSGGSGGSTSVGNASSNITISERGEKTNDQEDKEEDGKEDDEKDIKDFIEANKKSILITMGVIIGGVILIIIITSILSYLGYKKHYKKSIKYLKKRIKLFEKEDNKDKKISKVK